MRGIARVTGVSWDWLQKYVNSKMRHIPRCISVTDKSKGRLTLECDEMWSFVSSKKNKVDVWLAIDRDTREIVGCYVGDRTRKSARKLWRALPSVYRQWAVTYYPERLMVNIAVAPSKAFARIRCSQKPALVSIRIFGKHT
jgi:hypothetical protein